MYYREADWKPKTARDRWTTRPDDRGPYFAPITWEMSAKIKSAIKQGVAALSDQSLAPELAKLAGRNRITQNDMNFGIAADPLFAAPSASLPGYEPSTPRIHCSPTMRQRRKQALRSPPKTPLANADSFSPSLNQAMRQIIRRKLPLA